MKIGLVFKKQFQDAYGAKIEIYGNEVTIKREQDSLLVEAKRINSGSVTKRRFPVEAIQLIYLGEWNK